MLKKQLIFFCFRHLEIWTVLRPVQLQRSCEKMKANFRKNCLQIFKSNALTLATLAGVIGGTTRCFFLVFWVTFLKCFKNIEFILLLALFKHGVNGISLHKNDKVPKTTDRFFFYKFHMERARDTFKMFILSAKVVLKLSHCIRSSIKAFNLYIRYCYEDHFWIPKMLFIEVSFSWHHSVCLVGKMYV